MTEYIGNLAVPNSKVCSKCAIEMPISAFSRNCRSNDGRRPDCKVCCKKRQQNYYLRTRNLKGKYGVAPMDLIGQKFGRLTVLKRGCNDKQGKIQWECLCECGNRVLVRRTCLRNHTTQSCGCLAREVARITIKHALRSCGKELPAGVAAKRDVLQGYKRNAKKRGYPWKLSDDEAFLLMSGNCHYCGAKPGTKHEISNNGGFVYNGLDRKDNEKGYTQNNVVSCCPVCNRAKSHVSYKEFVTWAKKIAEVHN